MVQTWYMRERKYLAIVLEFNLDKILYSLRLILLFASMVCLDINICLDIFFHCAPSCLNVFLKSNFEIYQNVPFFGLFKRSHGKKYMDSNEMLTQYIF
jgi:hypothetical protein